MQEWLSGFNKGLSVTIKLGQRNPHVDNLVIMLIYDMAQMI